jgi:hypothetical protein
MDNDKILKSVLEDLFDSEEGVNEELVKYFDYNYPVTIIDNE